MAELISFVSLQLSTPVGKLKQLSLSSVLQQDGAEKDAFSRVTRPLGSKLLGTYAALHERSKCAFTPGTPVLKTCILQVTKPCHLQ